MPQPDTPLTFTVRRQAPELIVPDKPTPRELKPLSDIDDQPNLRQQISSIQIYRGDPKMNTKNPASVIRQALAKLLVFYYPFAGRLKEEGPDRKLMVDCAGQGILFIEAEADVRLEQFGYPLLPPFPCLDELLYDVPGSSKILDSPLLLIQVTRLLCGGFLFATRLNHTMSDAKGISQFKIALGELARGASTPSVLPIWRRDLLFARDQPRVTCTHPEFDEMGNTPDEIITQDAMAYKSFFFGSTEMLAIRQILPAHLKNRPTFEVLTAYLWRCRTIALRPNPKDNMRVGFTVDARAKFKSFIPIGYYGNKFALATAISTAEDLSNKPLSHALDLVMTAKFSVTEEYMRSLADLMKIKDRPVLKLDATRFYVVSDLTCAEFDVVDFGWGKPAYGGPFIGAYSYASIYTPYINNKGESGTVVPICLPSEIMKNFVEELRSILVQDDNNNHVLQDTKLPALSRL